MALLPPVPAVVSIYSTSVGLALAQPMMEKLSTGRAGLREPRKEDSSTLESLCRCTARRHRVGSGIAGCAAPPLLLGCTALNKLTAARLQGLLLRHRDGAAAPVHRPPLPGTNPARLLLLCWRLSRPAYALGVVFTTLPSMTAVLPSRKAMRDRPSQFLKESTTSGWQGSNTTSAISLAFRLWGASSFLPPVSLPT